MTPVLDAVIARHDVDADRIAVIGVSQAGYWVPRALAFEHRFAAAVVDPGVVDVSTSWTAQLPDELARCSTHHEQATFDRGHADGRAFSRDTERALAFRGAPYGIDSIAYALYRRSWRTGWATWSRRSRRRCSSPIRRASSSGPASRSSCTTCSPATELVRFTAAEGADRHCEPMARPA